MPLFEFECIRCGHRREVLMPSAEESRTVYCDSPTCKPVVPGGKCRMVRVPSAPNVHFSGDGWTPKHYTK